MSDGALQAAARNVHLYNGKELQDELGLGWYDYGARMYSPTVGRWNGVDALAEDPNQIDKSPYAYAWNNPTNLTDPDGNCPACALIAKGLIEGGIEFGTQLAIKTALNDGDIAKAFDQIDWGDVGIATVGGMLSPQPGSGRAAVLTARVGVEGGKALIDVSREKGVQTSELIGGDKSMSETAIDAAVGMATSSASGNLVDGSRRATKEALEPSNYAPLTRGEKQAARSEHTLAKSEGFERSVNTSGGVIGATSSEAIKQATGAGDSNPAPPVPMVPLPTHPNDATRNEIFINPNFN